MYRPRGNFPHKKLVLLLFGSVMSIPILACGFLTSATAMPTETGEGITTVPGSTASPAPPAIATAVSPKATQANPDRPTPASPKTEPARTGTLLSGPELRGLVHPGFRAAVADLTLRNGGILGEVAVVEAARATWPDSSLGCPEAEAFYAQVLTAGFRLVLAHRNQEYDYRIVEDSARLCLAPRTVEPLETTPLEGIWSSLSPMPTPRSEVAVAQLGGKVYVLGGFGAGANANEEYDPQSDTWAKRAPIPRGVDHGAAVALDGKLYFLGGFDGRWRPLASVWAYDPAGDEWSRKAGLPTARGALGAGALDGKIYTVGGVGEDGDLGTLEEYDPQTEAWRALSPMPTPRDHLAVAAVNGKIHAIAGRVGSYANNLDSHQAYDPAKGEWTELASLSTPRSGIAAAVVSRKIYVFGGEAVEGTFDQNQAYLIDNGAWLEMPPLPTARHGLGAAVLGNRIYVMAGGPTPGGSQSAVNEVFIVLGVPGP